MESHQTEREHAGVGGTADLAKGTEEHKRDPEGCTCIFQGHYQPWFLILLLNVESKVLAGLNMCVALLLVYLLTFWLFVGGKMQEQVGTLAFAYPISRVPQCLAWRAILYLGSQVLHHLIRKPLQWLKHSMLPPSLSSLGLGI